MLVLLPSPQPRKNSPHDIRRQNQKHNQVRRRCCCLDQSKDTHQTKIPTSHQSRQMAEEEKKDSKNPATNQDKQKAKITGDQEYTNN
jgi:hypothetical protein